MQPKQPRSPKLPRGAAYALAVACAFGSAAAAYLTVNPPLIEWRSDLEHKADLVRAKLVEGPALVADHAEQEKELAALMSRVDLVNQRVPDEPREGEFLADLSRLAAEYGVTIEDFRRGAATREPTHSVVTITVTARGGHAGLCRLIDSLAKLPRLVELTQLDIQSRPVGEEYPATFSYALYYAMAAGAKTAAL